MGSPGRRRRLHRVPDVATSSRGGKNDLGVDTPAFRVQNVCVPQLTIREVPGIVVSALKDQAKENGRSMEAEARVILRDAVSERLEAPAQV